MLIKIGDRILNEGEEYDGPGRADPRMTREQRREQLQKLGQTNVGRDVVSYYFHKYTTGGTWELGPIGAAMIEAILQHEYPNG